MGIGGYNFTVCIILAFLWENTILKMQKRTEWAGMLGWTQSLQPEEMHAGMYCSLDRKKNLTAHLPWNVRAEFLNSPLQHCVVPSLSCTVYKREKLYFLLLLPYMIPHDITILKLPKTSQFWNPQPKPPCLHL